MGSSRRSATGSTSIGSAPGTASEQVVGGIASIPAVRILREAGALHADDAESLARGRLHHNPPLQSGNDPSTQLLQAGDLGGKVVGLDVDVDAALVLYPLKLDDRLVGWRLEHHVVATGPRMGSVDRSPEGFRPKPCSLLDVGRIAVDQQRAEPRVMHAPSCLRSR